MLHSSVKSKSEPLVQPLRSKPPNEPFAHLQFLLPTSLPSPKSVTTSSMASETCCGLVLARYRLLGERSGDHRTTEICKRMDESSGKLLPALSTYPRTEVIELAESNSVYFLRSLFRNDQRARVGDPTRRTHLLSFEPTHVLRKKLKEQVIERRRLQRQEEDGKGRSRRAMGTLRALMIKGNKQAEAEYFQRREEEEQTKREVGTKCK